MQLFFPICHLEHWFSFVVDFKWKLFIFLDSNYGPNSDYQLAVRGPLVRISFSTNSSSFFDVSSFTFLSS
jgi:hypothetical protein